MTKLFSITGFLILFICQISAQTPDSLQQKIQQIVVSKNAEVGVSINGNNGKDTINLNADKHFPMQSVFKFHIALAVLSEVDNGKFALDQKIKIEQKDLLPNLYSPIREKYPNGAELTLAEILEYTVSASDNVGCEVLLRLIGGPQIVENYFKKRKLKTYQLNLMKRRNKLIGIYNSKIGRHQKPQTLFFLAKAESLSIKYPSAKADGNSLKPIT